MTSRLHTMGFGPDPEQLLMDCSYFDATWYAARYADVLESGHTPQAHYLRFGGRMGRDPGPNFDMTCYLAQNPSLIETGRNPLLHFLGQRDGIAYDLYQDPSLPCLSKLELRALWGNFDAEFYREQYQRLDLSQGGPNRGAQDMYELVHHYVCEGWRLGLSPCRWFDSLGYVVTLGKPLQEVGDPFLHYIRHGAKEGRAPMPFFQDRAWSPPQLERPWLREYGPVSRILSYTSDVETPCDTGHDIAVHIHLYHPEMLRDICANLQYLPNGVTVLVSIADARFETHIAAEIRSMVPHLGQIIVRRVPNRGRDVAPWVVTFAKEIQAHKIFLHIHSKRSGHDPAHRGWRTYLMHTLVGSPAIVSQILEIFRTQQDVGLVAAAYWPGLRRAPNFGDTRQIFHDLLRDMNVKSHGDFCPDFPAGSFFWCRTDCLVPLFELGLGYDDFAPEHGQICGTLAHGIERLIGALPEQTGLRMEMVAVDLAYDDSSLCHTRVLAPAQRNAFERMQALYQGKDAVRIAIKVPAPKPEFAHRWGDVHLARSLARAFERLGCIVRIDLLPEWYQAQSPEDDVVLVFRGVTRYDPNPAHINLMWHISHPTRVEMSELQQFDHVFVSAYRYVEDLFPVLKSRVSSLLQCSDPDVFFPPSQNEKGHALLFVGNSRKTQRWIPQVCVERDLPIAVYGAEWEGLLPEHLLLGTHIPNDQLAEHYGNAKIVLNDHWPDMAKKGFVSNRIFDAGLSGALVITDRFEGSEIFDGAVVECSTPDEVEEAVRYYLEYDTQRQEKAAQLRQRVLANHTVDLRAQAMLKIIYRLADEKRRKGLVV